METKKQIKKATIDRFEFAPEGEHCVFVSRFPYNGKKYTITKDKNGEDRLAYERIPCDVTGHSPGRLAVYHAASKEGKEIYAIIKNGRNELNPELEATEAHNTIEGIGFSILHNIEYAALWPFLIREDIMPQLLGEAKGRKRS